MRQSLIFSSVLLVLAACAGEAPPTPETLAYADPMPVMELPSVEAEEGVEEAIEGGPPMLEPLAYRSEVSDEGAASVEISLRAGENLVFLAKHAGCSVEDIARLSGIDVAAPLYPGDTLRIPLSEGDLARFEADRDAATAARMAHYFDKRGGLVGLRLHKVRTGETAWSIAHDVVGTPTWILSEYNRGVNLDRLQIGDELLVPVLGDTVADVLEEDEAAKGPAVEESLREGLLETPAAPNGSVWDEVEAQ